MIKIRNKILNLKQFEADEAYSAIGVLEKNIRKFDDGIEDWSQLLKAYLTNDNGVNLWNPNRKFLSKNVPACNISYSEDYQFSDLEFQRKDNAYLYYFKSTFLSENNLPNYWAVNYFSNRNELGFKLSFPLSPGENHPKEIKTGELKGRLRVSPRGDANNNEEFNLFNASRFSEIEETLSGTFCIQNVNEISTLLPDVEYLNFKPFPLELSSFLQEVLKQKVILRSALKYLRNKVSIFNLRFLINIYRDLRTAYRKIFRFLFKNMDDEGEIFGFVTKSYRNILFHFYKSSYEFGKRINSTAPVNFREYGVN